MSHSDPNYPGNMTTQSHTDLTDTDKRRIDRDTKASIIHKFLRNKIRLNFGIGDVLIKKMKRYGETRPQTETVSASSAAPKKFMCVYIDEYGIPFVKPLKVDGNLSEYIINCSQMDLDSNWFEQDPDQAAHVILSEDEKDFDPLETFKADKDRRAMIRNSNRKIREKTNNPSEIRTAFSKVVPGSKMWISDDRDTCNNLQEYTVLEINYYGLAAIKANASLVSAITSWKLTQAEAYVTDFKAPNLLVLKVDHEGTIEHMTENEITRRNLFFTKPRGTRTDATI